MKLDAVRPSLSLERYGAPQSKPVSLPGRRGIASWLDHPITRGLDLDDPRTTELCRRIVREKRFLRRVHEEWYATIAAALPPGAEPVLEVGTGAGFLSGFVPGMITSDVFKLSAVDLVLDAAGLPFQSGSLRGAAMNNVLHHLSRPRRVFAELARCVRPGGVISMIEPWVSAWSRQVYPRFHHESFLPDAPDWEWVSTGPLTGANIALPWIMFHRDRERFERELPQWAIRSVQPLMPFRYIVSGGVSRRTVMPVWTFSLWRALERALDPWLDRFAMFAAIVLERR